MWELAILILRPWRLTWNIIMEVWKIIFSFQNGWFVGFMLIVQGVSGWWFWTHLKNMRPSKWESFPGLGVKMKNNVWNHHLLTVIEKIDGTVPTLLVYEDPLVTYLLVSVPSILTWRYSCSKVLIPHIQIYLETHRKKFVCIVAIEVYQTNVRVFAATVRIYSVFICSYTVYT